MPIDERVRSALQQRHAPTPGDDLLDAIVKGATRARRLRACLASVAAAVACLLVAVGVQHAMSESRTDGPAVDTPTSGLPTQPGPDPNAKLDAADSPLDGRTWTGPASNKAERLAALNGTGLERFGNGVYARVLAHHATYVTFHAGVAELRMLDVVLNRPQVLLPGAFTVRGHTVVIVLDDVPGTTTFRWKRVPIEAGERLELTFIDTKVKSLYGAPAEVFLRMWSVAPFWQPQPREPSG
jgi:hypothetical protein